MASGCPMPCSLTELDDHAYVRDDTMFIKIIVDTKDLEKSEARSKRRCKFLPVIFTLNCLSRKTKKCAKKCNARAG